MKKIFMISLILILFFCFTGVSASDVNDTNSMVQDNNYQIEENYVKSIESNENEDNFQCLNNVTGDTSFENYYSSHISDDVLMLEESNNNNLSNSYSKGNVEIMIADEVEGNAYCIRIFISNNSTGTLNVYVDNSLKWTNEVTKSSTGNYGVVLYPKDLGMAVGKTHLVKVTFGQYSYQCNCYWVPEPDPSLDDLEEIIKKSGSTVYLNKNYSYLYDGENGVSIDKNVVINGNGHYLDGHGKRILYIKSGIDVTLSNIIFKNGVNTYGGAIYIGSSNVKIINCTFINNYANKKGCSIYGSSVNSLYIDKTIFRENDEIDDTNGIINVAGKNIVINNCEFENGYYDYHLSIACILNANNVTVSKCNFKPKSITFFKIFSIKGKNILFDSCNFTQNDDCIYFITEESPCTIKNCYFKNNKGTLIDFDYYTSSYLLLINSTFENNGKHNIINWNCYNGEINSCKFLENSNFYNLINTHDYVPKLYNNTGLGVSTKITIEKSKIYLQEDKLNIYLKDSFGNILSSKKIGINIGDNHFERFTDYKGLISLDVSNIIEGIYNSLIYFEGSTDYDSSSIKETIILEFKTDTILNIKNISSYQFDNILEGVLTSYNGDEINNAIISVNCNGETFYTTTDKNGKFSLLLNLTPNIYKITTSYGGNGLYDSNQVISTISVYSSIILENPTEEYDVNLKLKTTFLDKTGNYLQYQYVLFKLDGEDTVLITGSNGEVTFSKKVSGGWHELKVVNPLTKEEVTRIIFVKKETPIILSSNFNTVYNEGKNLIATLKNNLGDLVVGVKVTVKFSNGKTLIGTTNKNGQVKVSTNGLTPKTYTATITFSGNNNYNKVSKSVKIVVKKATPKITAKSITFKKFISVKKYSITLKTNKNKVMKNTKVTIKINKKTYSSKTNSKGVAIFKITKFTKKGIFQSVINYNGDKYYNKVTKKVNIIIK